MRTIFTLLYKYNTILRPCLELKRMRADKLKKKNQTSLPMPITTV